MDTNELIDEIKSRFDFNESKLYLYEKYKNRLLLSVNGGTFNIDSTMFSILTSFSTDTVILLDIYKNPIRVNRIETLENCISIYETVMEEWLKEFDQLKRNR